MSTKQITDENFQSEIESSKVPVLVDFWAEWGASRNSVTLRNGSGEGGQAPSVTQRGFPPLKRHFFALRNGWGCNNIVTLPLRIFWMLPGCQIRNGRRNGCPRRDTRRTSE